MSIADAIGVLRSSGLAERLGALEAMDAGDLELEAPSGERGPSGLVNEAALGRLVEATHKRVRVARRRGRRALLVGGHCPVLLGALVRSPTKKERAAVMLDGHEDAWPPLDSRRRRGVREWLRTRARAPQELIAAALEAIEAKTFWLHIDLDILSSEAFPAVDYPQPGGLGWAQLDDLAVTAARDRRCAGASIVIYNPTSTRTGPQQERSSTSPADWSSEGTDLDQPPVQHHLRELTAPTHRGGRWAGRTRPCRSGRW